jgi:tripartite-type tricarboxylate transporter receptor subunit TctC
VDQVARMLAEALAKTWGVPVVVENKPGASGIIGAESVVRGEASGHRLLFAFTVLTQAPAFLLKVPYNLQTDFAPVLHVANARVVLAVATESPIRTLKDYIDRGKRGGKPLSFGSIGMGTTYHIYGEALARAKGLNLLHVPYRGEALALTDMLGGQIDSSFLSLGAALPYARAGRIRVLGVVSKGRSAILPDVPTFVEESVDLDAAGWFGVLAPSGTPQPVVQQIATDLRAVLSNPAIAARLTEAGFDRVSDSDPATFRTFLDTESRKWKSLIIETGIKPQ